MTKRHLGVAVVACTNNASTSSSASTTVPASTSTTSPQSSTWTAVWPTASSSTRYGTPDEAARGFATDYLHIVDPVVGQFQQGDSRSGEVPVRPSSTGPVTTVLVRQLGSDSSWWVLGAGTAAIRLTDPAWEASIMSPVTLRGPLWRSSALSRPRCARTATTSPSVRVSSPAAWKMTPFSGSLVFSKASTKYGAVVLYTISAKDGAVLEASVIRVRFG